MLREFYYAKAATSKKASLGFISLVDVPLFNSRNIFQKPNQTTKMFTKTSSLKKAKDMLSI